MTDKQQHPTLTRILLRVVTPISVLLAAGWAALEFSNDRPARGAYAAVIAVVVTLSGLFFSRRAPTNVPSAETLPDPRSLRQAYIFFAISGLIALVLSSLMIAGAVRGGPVFGVIGLFGSALCAYAVINGSRTVSRLRAADHPHDDSTETRDDVGERESPGGRVP